MLPSLPDLAPRGLCYGRGMLSRERLWQRVSGADLWGLPWAMAAACLLPWLLPERWDGALSFPQILAGWGVVLASLLLLRYPAWRVVCLSALLVWVTFLGLRGRLLWERALPQGFQEIQGTLSAPWRTQGERRLARMILTHPKALAGCELPVALPLEGTPGPEPGTPVRFRGELRVVEPAPTFIAERPLWRARSDEAPRRIFLRSAQVMEALGPPEPSPLLRLRTFFHRRFAALPLSEGTARDLWGALTLGIPPAQDEVFSAFAESGTIHTLVVSGLQVTLVMVALEALWRRLLKRGSGVASAIGGVLYGAMVGFSAPVWRGLLMGLAWAFGRSRGWKLPPVLTLHLALLAWLLTHPAAGCEPGFLLAWWALLGLIWGAEPLAGLLSPWLGRWSLSAARFIAPWLSTFPLLALLHGGAPLWGVAANVVVLPLVTFLTPLCLALILVPLPGVVQLLGKLLAWTGDALVPAFARIAPLATGILWPWLMLAVAWIWLAQRHAGLRRTRLLTVGILLASFGLLILRGTGRAPATLSLEAVDVGQGDALLVRVPGGQATVVDTGPSPWAGRRLARVLSRRGVREPVSLVVTHPHGDHAGGWAALARLWPFETVSIPATALPEAAWTLHAPSTVYAQALSRQRGDGWSDGAAQWSVRWPPKPLALQDANMLSLVLRMQWRDRELWLMGDALGLQERDLMDLGEPEPGLWRRLLKPGHHGSRSASDPTWLERLRPEAALLTAGRHNPFGFPHDEVLERLERAGCHSLWKVGETYGVRIEAVPEGWRATTGEGR